MKTDKIVGTMMGLAVGDALGVPVEFMDRESIRDKYGVLDKMVGGGSWGQKAGTVSDDTAMALAVAEGIIKDPKNPVPAVGDKFIEWYEGKPFDVGICCSQVINRAMWNGRKWHEASRWYDYTSGGRSGGNGGLMRSAFVGAYYGSTRDVRKYAKDICKMTHWNEDAQNDCVLLCLIINALIDGGTKEDVEDIIMSFPEDESKRYNLGVIEGYPFMVEPKGSSVNSMSCALKCLLTTRSFKDAVVMAVNMGGDADTIGAITGAMAGALYGADAIPKDWKEALDSKVVDKIINVCSMAAIKKCGGIDDAIRDICGWSEKKVQEGHEDTVGFGHEG